MKKFARVIVCGSLVLALSTGCASFGKFTPEGAAKANQAVTVAQGLLHTLDGFYGALLAYKELGLPDYTVQATRALSIADLAAVVLRQVIAGATVTDAELNAAAGQVDGAKAILAGMKGKQ